MPAPNFQDLLRSVLPNDLNPGEKILFFFGDPEILGFEDEVVDLVKQYLER